MWKKSSPCCIENLNNTTISLCFMPVGLVHRLNWPCLDQTQAPARRCNASSLLPLPNFSILENQLSGPSVLLKHFVSELAPLPLQSLIFMWRIFWQGKSSQSIVTVLIPLRDALMCIRFCFEGLDNYSSTEQTELALVRCSDISHTDVERNGILELTSTKASTSFIGMKYHDTFRQDHCQWLDN